ncbi:hypothetical protein L1264_20700 [Pseudoalteromonas sp. APAL1]|uniref:hypothetical protein n=1 Tax=unclassified Pseudoalteromonas TaxID=194690 RepID=UPI001EF878D6|nr:MULTISPECIES: hypothetical protein [unclassified Pseudoalteromonas]MCF2922882.1 hypothetical protein [Pseudoalteromonas sp. APAL1]MCG7556259.1 hypothetical protein [Pseudoalteromonas sp. Of11M-6]
MTKNWIEETKQDPNSSWESGTESKDTKLGRPEMPANQKRKGRFTMNMNDAEFELIEGVAKRLGMPVAVYIRQQALLAAENFMKGQQRLF